jgi:putative addiction module component (TIGR02574 family)
VPARPARVGRYGEVCLPTDAFTHATPSARLVWMNARVDHLLDEMLGLPAEERSALAVALLDSLETADGAAVSGLWRAEVNRRRAELRAGQVQAAPWSEVRARLSSL